MEQDVESPGEPPGPSEALGWSDPLVRLRGIGDKRGAALFAAGLETLADLLFLVPQAYTLPASLWTSADQPAVGSTVSLAAQVISGRRGFLRGRSQGYLELRVRTDAKLDLRVRFYGQGYLLDRYPAGATIAVSGQMDKKGRTLVAQHHRLIDDQEQMQAWLAAPLPRLPSVAGISPGVLRLLIAEALRHVTEKEDPLPPATRTKLEVCGLEEALKALHRPRSLEVLPRATERLLFDRFLAYLLPRVGHEQPNRRAPVIPCGTQVRERILRRLPFALTQGQERVIEEILGELNCAKPMRRLLQGGVGTGKTAVAMVAALATIAAGHQAMFLVPTESLARQHMAQASRWLSDSRVSVVSVTSSATSAERRQVAEQAQAGEAHLVIGTHAVLGSRMSFKSLGLVVIDEQHRFGVVQRWVAQRKGTAPHVLAMTATPIPRSLMMATTGWSRHSRLVERPMSRPDVETHVVSEEAAWSAARDHVGCGGQVYLVFPGIDAEGLPSVRREGRALVTGSGPLRDIPFAVLHGGLAKEDQHRALDAFVEGRVRVILATQMVEVGLDVTDATLMVIVGADRFGLATLHQLRGRVGRGERPGVCLLLPSDNVKPEGMTRLELMCDVQDGFELAERDLELRGPGTILGVRQAGFRGLVPIAGSREHELLSLAQVALREGIPLDRSYYECVGTALRRVPKSIPRDKS